MRSLGELSQPTLVYDANGTQIGKLGVQDREPAELAEVPQILINAVIATEDKTFWKNPGIDVSGVSRAFVENLTEGKISQGGSTITQQLVKNRILGNKRDLQRKAKELILAYRLNDKYSKREILKQYLNTVYFGQGSYGVKAAARRFFRTLDPAAPFGVRGKQLNELTVGEAALLAGADPESRGGQSLRAPRTARRSGAREVLKGMVAQHYITQAQADEGNQEGLTDREALVGAAARQHLGREGPGGSPHRPAARRDASGAARQGAGGRAEGVHDQGSEPPADGRPTRSPTGSRSPSRDSAPRSSRWIRRPAT